MLPRSYISTDTTPRASPPDNCVRSISSVKDNILAEMAQLARRAVDAQLAGLKRQCEEQPKQLAALHHSTVKQGFPAQQQSTASRQTFTVKTSATWQVSCKINAIFQLTTALIPLRHWPGVEIRYSLASASGRIRHMKLRSWSERNVASEKGYQSPALLNGVRCQVIWCMYLFSH